MRQDGRVGEIILLALGSAVFPALLACVAILISRPEPRRLLLAFYVGGLGISVACGLIGVKLFHDGKKVAGNTASAPHPAYSIAGGSWDRCWRGCCSRAAGGTRWTAGVPGIPVAARPRTPTSPRGWSAT